VEILEATLFLAALAGLLSVMLVVASKRFAVEEDPLVGQVSEILPQYNCGACGFPGCAGFAGHLVSSRDPEAVCIPGGPELAKRIGALLGMAVKETTPTAAHVFCKGTDGRAVSTGEYIGLKDCIAADLVNAATKECPSGCLGLGSCVRACQFDAIRITDGIAEVIEDKCVACGKCVAACPRHLIRMEPEGSKVCVECSTRGRGAGVKKYCQVGCIKCMLCVKNCPEKAISLVNEVIVIDHAKCKRHFKCIAVCPQKCILTVKLALPELPKAEGGEA